MDIALFLMLTNAVKLADQKTIANKKKASKIPVWAYDKACALDKMSEIKISFVSNLKSTPNAKRI
jgi:hypothetical protein